MTRIQSLAKNQIVFFTKIVEDNSPSHFIKIQKI